MFLAACIRSSKPHTCYKERYRGRTEGGGRRQNGNNLGMLGFTDVEGRTLKDDCP